MGGGAQNGHKESYSMRARIDGLDNGATMIIRRHQTLDSPGTVVLKKVYVDFDALVKDLKETMKFKFPK
jgi:hypothetical protein